jgi:hypothetical protein
MEEVLDDGAEHEKATQPAIHKENTMFFMDTDN